MTDNISITGLVATPLRHGVGASGVSFTNFRLASNYRRFDRAQNKWVDLETNWFSVTAFRSLADNVAESLHQGDRVLVTGRLRIAPWDNGEKKGTNVEILADAIGPDLFWGTAQYTRTALSARSGRARMGGGSAESFPSAADADAPDLTVALSEDAAVPF